MKLIVTLSLALGLFAGQRAWSQSMEDVSYYLNNPRVSQTARECYKNDMSSTDIDVVNNIADSLCARNADARAFYMYLVCRMLVTSGGIPPGKVGAMMQRLTESRPDAVVSFLTTPQNEAVEKSYFEYWADGLAYQFTNHCACETATCILTSLRRAHLQCKADGYPILTRLYTEVKAKVCENEALAVAMKVPEVQAIRKNPNSSAGIYSAPTKCLPYYWVKVWENDGDKATLDLLVDPEQFTVMFYDAHDNRAMALETWREKLH